MLHPLATHTSGKGEGCSNLVVEDLTCPVCPRREEYWGLRRAWECESQSRLAFPSASIPS